MLKVYPKCCPLPRNQDLSKLEPTLHENVCKLVAAFSADGICRRSVNIIFSVYFYADSSTPNVSLTYQNGSQFEQALIYARMHAPTQYSFFLWLIGFVENLLGLKLFSLHITSTCI